jgi:hypothetical protein
MNIENYLYILYHQRGQRAPEIHYTTTNYDDMIIELYRVRKLGDSFLNVFRIELNKSYRKDDSQYSMSTIQLTNGSKMNITKDINLSEEYKRVCRDRNINAIIQNQNE